MVILAEDQRHQRFIRGFLYQKGLKPHEIRMEALPSGRGCGEQWVRERYSSAVKVYRLRSAKAKSALVVAIDADTHSTDTRQHQLRESLKQTGMSERGVDEAIVHLIPKRSIETWVLFLSGQVVDEDSDYSHDPDMDHLIAKAAHTFLDLSRMNPPLVPDAMASLSAAVQEAGRLR